MKTIQYKHKKCIYNTYKPRKSIYEIKIFKAKIGLCIEVKICNTRQGMHPNKCQVTQLQSQPQPYKKTLIEQPKPKTLRSPSSMIYQVGREAIFERERERERLQQECWLLKIMFGSLEHCFQNRTGPGGRTVKTGNRDKNRFFKPKEPDFLLIP